MSLGVAILGRYDPVEQIGLDRLGDAGAHRVLQPSDIDGEQDIGRAVGALGLDALLKARACGDDVDLDAGILGEGVEQRLDELALAVGVDIDLARLGERGAGSSDCAGSHRGTRERAHASRVHGHLHRRRRLTSGPNGPASNGLTPQIQ